MPHWTGTKRRAAKTAQRFSLAKLLNGKEKHAMGPRIHRTLTKKEKVEESGRRTYKIPTEKRKKKSGETDAQKKSNRKMSERIKSQNGGRGGQKSK